MPDNAKKAATLLQMLPDTEAMQLRASLSAAEEDRLLQATAAASTLHAAQQESIVEEFLQLTEKPATTFEQLPGASPHVTPGPTPSLPEDEIFNFFHQLDANILFSLVAEESIQTTAVVLAHLPTQLAASVISCFDIEIQAPLVQQISNLQPVNLQTLVQIADILQQKLERHLNQPSLLAEM